MSEIAAAIHADAEAARAEIRAAGIVCPSCGTNMGDLPKDHMLGISPARSHEPGPGGAVVLARHPVTAKCGSGTAVELMDETGSVTTDFETFKDATNVNLYDTFRKAESKVFDEIMFGGAGHRDSRDGFAGFLSILEQQ